MDQENPSNENDRNQSEAPANSAYQDIVDARRITFNDIKSHLTGPVVSLIAHIIIIVICLTFVVSAPEVRKEVAVEIKELEVKNIEKLPDPPPEERVEMENPIEVDAPVSNVTSTAPDNASIAPSTATGDVGVGFSDAPDVPMSNVLSIAPSNSPLVLPGVMAGRSKGGIKSALQKYNRGSGATERSVSKGLNWLKEHQNADGSWGVANAPAMTGLATLAFLAHGETPSSQEYGACVLKAIRKLIEYGNGADANGMIKNPGNGYGHAIVAYALSEAFALTKIPMIEEPMNKTIGRVITGQNTYGSYNYVFNNAPLKETGKPRSDLSVAGWNYQALKAAFAAGCTVKGLEAAIDNGVKGIKKTHYTGAGFSYGDATGKEGGGSPSMTAVGVLCLQLLGEGKSKEALTGLKYIETAGNGGWLKCDWPSKSGNLYQWYYQTQALFQGYSGTGGTWDEWNKEFQKSLMKEQESDGHWQSPAGKYGDKPEWVAGDEGKVYSTSLCCLMLEVYYRYLPTFKVAAHGPAEGGAAAPKKDTKDELRIE
jgi:hypothetical protein